MAAAKDKRQAILKALEKVLQKRQFDEVTVDMVAETAGVGKGTVYRYFEDKQDLFLQMVREFLKEELDDLAVVAVSTPSPRERLASVGEAMSRHILAHGQYIRTLHCRQFTGRKQNTSELMREHHGRLDRILTQLFDDAVTCGTFAADVDLPTALCIFKGAIMSYSIRKLHDIETTSIPALVDLMIDGFGREA